MTQPGGVNVRTAPNITALQATRLPGGCGVPVDGFCLGGTVIKDAADEDLVDTRWLRLARLRDWRAPLAQFLSGAAKEERFIAAGAIDEFISAELVPRLPNADCKGAKPVGQPGQAELTAALIEPETPPDPNEQPGDVIALTVTADNTFEFGFALKIQGESRTGNPYRNIPADDRPTDISKKATWAAAATAAYLTQDVGDVVIHASRCLAIGAPLYAKDDDAFNAATLAYQLTEDGILTKIDTPKMTPSEQRLLAAEACREPNP